MCKCAGIVKGEGTFYCSAIEGCKGRCVSVLG